MTLYDIGDTVRVTVTFTNSAGTATDPSAVTLSVKDPKGTKTTYTYGSSSMVKSATGIYYYDLTATLPGSYKYVWKGTGALVVAEENRFEVRRQAATE